MTDDRPDPDLLLARVQAEEARHARGKLKIFFGAAPGVGKTYAMLEAARKVAKEGLDVLIGYVEPHSRPETQALVLGLDVLARRAVDYRGTKLLEFDLEAALAQRPQLIVVDELAHSNAPGMTHTKRWQDVLRLIEAGIDVYTTLNVQHLESLNDVVAQISGVIVRETVPDSVFEQADEVELVDLPPGDLLERLREGKIYVPREAERAIANFFTKGNLLALRELALRRTAERVGQQMDSYRGAHDVRSAWAARERLLVCIGPSPFAARLIRATRRMAAALKAPWIAVHVETPRDAGASAAARTQLAQNLRLVEQLGGETAALCGPHRAEEIIDYARRRNVTRIVVGKPRQPWWREFLRGSLVYQLTRRSGDIDVYVISGDPQPEPRPAVVARRSGPAWPAYLLAAAVVALCTGMGALLAPHLEPTNLVMVYLLGVVVVSLRLGRGPSILASVLGVAAFDFCFIPPQWTFAVRDTQYVLTFAVMLLTGLVINTLAGRVKFQVDSARRRERRTAALYAVSRELAATPSREHIARIARRHVAAACDVDAVVLLPDAQGNLALAGGDAQAPALDAHEDAVARWVRDHAEVAGRGTATLPGAKGVYVPLGTQRPTLGVLGAFPRGPAAAVDLEQLHLLETFAGLIALALERANLEAEAERVRLDIETERLRSALLSAVSHDLRTPLSVITGASSTLLDNDRTLAPEVRRELVTSILDESQRLNHLVANLLDMTRLQAGALKVQKEWTPVEEVIGAALGRVARLLHGRAVTTQLEPDLPLVALDDLLMQQVLINLLENAARHTPAGAAVEVAARRAGATLLLEVADRGPGLPPGDPRRLFESFFQAAETRPRASTGLGLAICRGIVQLHDGQIVALPRPGGGAIFRITLPLDEAPPAVPPPEALPAPRSAPETPA